MKFWLSLVLMTLTLPALAGTAADDIRISDPRVREMPPTVKTSAGFLTMTNQGTVDHALVGAESPWCGHVELHTHIHDNGVMRMRPVEKMPVPAGGVTKLQPGGLHLMLMELKRPLHAGEKMPITLIFEDGSRKSIEAPVRRFEQMSGMKMPMMHHEMGMPMGGKH